MFQSSKTPPPHPRWNTASNQIINRLWHNSASIWKWKLFSNLRNRFSENKTIIKSTSACMVIIIPRNIYYGNSNWYVSRVEISAATKLTVLNQKLCCMYSLVNQTLWSQGAYRLEIISARSERVWWTAHTIFVHWIDRFCRLLIGVEVAHKGDDWSTASSSHELRNRMTWYSNHHLCELLQHQ